MHSSKKRANYLYIFICFDSIAHSAHECWINCIGFFFHFSFKQLEKRRKMHNCATWTCFAYFAIMVIKKLQQLTLQGIQLNSINNNKRNEKKTSEHTYFNYNICVNWRWKKMDGIIHLLSLLFFLCVLPFVIYCDLKITRVQCSAHILAWIIINLWKTVASLQKPKQMIVLANVVDDEDFRSINFTN